MNSNKNGEHVMGAAGLIEVAPIVAEERITRAAERIINDLEMDTKDNAQLPGHHVGTLAERMGS